jgi:hypothetical protein
MIYHGRCIIDCGEHGHNDVEMLKMIPAGTKLYTASALAALQAENERLKEASDFDHAEYKRLRDELRTKLAEAQADAARWKWFQENVYRYPYDDHGCGPEFDLSNEAIDAAMGDV